MPDKRAVTDWARENEANQRPDGARSGRAAPDCPDCDGSGFKPVRRSFYRVGDGEKVWYDAVSVCECRRAEAESRVKELGEV